MEPGPNIVDPASGDLLDQLPGKQIGQVEIVEVHDRYAVGKSVTRTQYQVGQRLEPVEPNK